LAAETVKRGAGGGGSLFGSGMRRDVVVGVNRKSRHRRGPLCRALRGHDMDHSARLETQGNSQTISTLAKVRRWGPPEARGIRNSLAFRC
jgi:hypothetical protein